NTRHSTRLASILAIAIFFFQAEDGIRDFHVTGVQTCALPIYLHFPHVPRPGATGGGGPDRSDHRGRPILVHLRGGPDPGRVRRRSEERRVGKECRSRWGSDIVKKR